MDSLLDLEDPLPTSHDNKFTTLFHSESNHMPSLHYSSYDISVRFEIISNIKHFSLNFDPFLPYLATNYLDRFLSTQSIPGGKPWILRLIAISCVSLALKMRKTDYSVADIQNDGGGFMFDSQTIQRMELMILGALKWRMRSITPFGFINFFISFFKFKDPPSCQALKERATEIIFKSQNGVTCSEFKPSIVAASALLYASHELFPLQFPCFRNAISNCSYVHKDNFYACYNVIQEIVLEEGYESIQVDTLSNSSTPVNVLDLCWSSSSMSRSSGSDTERKTATNTNTVVVEGANGSASGGTIRLERDSKRRKFKCFGSQNSSSFQLSQVQQC